MTNRATQNSCTVILQLQDYLQISTVLQGSNLNTVYTTFRERSSQIKLVQIVLKLH